MATPTHILNATPGRGNELCWEGGALYPVLESVQLDDGASVGEGSRQLEE